MSPPCLTSLTVFLNFSNVYLFLRERKKQSTSRRGAERGRHRIWSRLLALSCQHRARCGARTHKPWDHDPSWSRMLNWLSHPGAPTLITILKAVSPNTVTLGDRALTYEFSLQQALMFTLTYIVEKTQTCWITTLWKKVSFWKQLAVDPALPG